MGWAGASPLKPPRVVNPVRGNHSCRVCERPAGRGGLAAGRQALRRQLLSLLLIDEHAAARAPQPSRVGHVLSRLVCRAEWAHRIALQPQLVGPG